MKKVVIASEFFDPNQNSTGFLVNELQVALTDNFIVQRVMPSKFLSTWSPQKRVSNVVKKLLILMSLMLKTRRMSGRETTLLIISNPFLNWFMTRAFGNFKAVHILAFDVFPETGQAFLSNWKVDVLRKLRKWSLTRNLKFICIGRDMAEYISKECPKHQITDVGLWVEAKKVDADKELSIDAVLLFFGNFGKLTDFFVIKKLCQAPRRDYAVKVVGNGSEKFADHLNRMPLVTLLKAVKFEERMRVYDNIAASLVVQHPRLKGFAVPSKAFFSWENHVPIIYFGHKDSELFRLVHENPFLGYAFEYDHLERPEVCEEVNSILINLIKVRRDKRIGEWLSENRVRSITRIKSCLSEGKS